MRNRLTTKEKLGSFLTLGALCLTACVAFKNITENSKTSQEIIWLNQAISITNNQYSFDTEAIKFYSDNGDKYVMFYGEKTDHNRQSQTGAYTYVLPDYNAPEQYPNIIDKSNKINVKFDYNVTKDVLMECLDLVENYPSVSWTDCSKKQIKNLWQETLNTKSVNINDNDLTL